MLVVVLEAFGYLRPHLFVLVLDLVLIFVHAEQPAAVNGVVTVAVNVHDSVQTVVYNIVHDLLNAVEPLFVDLIAGSFAYL